MCDILQLFGKRLRELRHGRFRLRSTGSIYAYCSQKRFARDVGLDRSYLSDLEAGKTNVSLKILWRICRVLRISLAEFFDSPDFEVIVLKEATETPPPPPTHAIPTVAASAEEKTKATGKGSQESPKVRCRRKTAGASVPG